MWRGRVDGNGIPRDKPRALLARAECAIDIRKQAGHGPGRACGTCRHGAVAARGNDTTRAPSIQLRKLLSCLPLLAGFPKQNLRARNGAPERQVQ